MSAERIQTRAQHAVLDASELDAGAVSAWRALAAEAAEANPFAGPEFVLAAVEGRGDDVALLVVRDGARWLACVPVRRGPRWRHVPLPSFTPWLPEYAYSSTPLLRRDALPEAAEGLVALLLAERSAAALVLDPFDRSGPVGAALEAALAARGLVPLVLSEWERAALRRRPEDTYLTEALGKSSRKKLRSAKRGLGTALGGEVIAADRSPDPAAWETFLTLEAAGWKGEQGTALACRGGDAAFFRRLCANASATGVLQILALEVDGRTAAMQCNLVQGEALYAFKVAYDPALARHSPGALLEVEAVGIFHGLEGVAFADSCADPDNALINRMWPDRRRMQSVLIPTGAPSARLLRPAVRAGTVARSVRRRLRRATATATATGSPVAE